MQLPKGSSIAMRLALAAVSAPLVCIATAAFSIYVPSTSGYFNVGETAIYVIAIVLGPVIGAFAGGVGAGAADLLLGFLAFAPATGVIKALEGAAVGILSSRKPRFRSKTSWKVFTLSIGIVIGALLGGIGSIYYSGTVELRVGIPPPEISNVVFSVPSEIWYAIGVAIALLIASAGFWLEAEVGWLAFASITGGTVMVTGYFLYEMYLLYPLFGVEAVAIAEIPINIAQMLIGTVVALPIAKILRRSFPQLKS